MMIARRLKSARSLAPAALPVLLVAFAFHGCKLVTYENLASVTVSPANPSIAGTTTQQFTAKATYSDETPEKDVSLEAAWTSSDPSVATVSSSGLATPVQPGTTTITASVQGRSGSTTLTVTNAQLQSIDVTTATPSIANGTRAQFTATGHFDDSTTQDLTSQVTWTSSESSVSISNTLGSNGLATSTALGAASSTITATLGVISGLTTLTVNDVTLTSMSVTPATATIKENHTQQFTATGAFSDGSTQVMTGEVTWNSLDTSTATITPTGLATGKLAGSTTITATSSELLGSASGTAPLTVQACAGSYGC